MTEDKNTIMDDQLANFTDQLLAGNTPQDMDDPELEALTITVKRLHSAFGENAETDADSERLQAQVMAHWTTLQQGKPHRQNNRSPWWRKINRQRMSLAISLAVIILLVVAVPWLLTSTPSMPGAAGAAKSSTIIGIGIIIMVITVLIWRLNNKK